jgi:hypothetical protein
MGNRIYRTYNMIIHPSDVIDSNGLGTVEQGNMVISR